jgi:hypothetical protein
VITAEAFGMINIRIWERAVPSWQLSAVISGSRRLESAPVGTDLGGTGRLEVLDVGLHRLLLRVTGGDRG